jgi:hypothetical protein
MLAEQKKALVGSPITIRLSCRSPPISIHATTQGTRSSNGYTRWQHSPVIMAMLTGNTMRSCQETEKLLEECLRSHSDDNICEAAARQMELCNQQDGLIHQLIASQQAELLPLHHGH